VIILDSSVMAEVLKPAPDPRLARWLTAQPRVDLYTSVFAQADILLNVEELPVGQRRTHLQSAVAEIFGIFEGRLLPYDADAARAYPQIVLNRKMMNQDIAPANAMLAAIARSRGATLATRHEPAFYGCGIRVVNPWL
jgi:predicted nucleic acid-binding protein